MKAILTKTLYATNTKPTRIKIQAEGVPHIVVSRDQFDGGEEEVHRAAALKLCEKYRWGTSLVSGGLPTPGQWVHCFVPQQGKVLIDLEPVWSDAEGCWTVTESDERGNALEVHLFKTEAEGTAFVEGWCRCGELNGAHEAANLALKRALSSDTGIPATELIEGLKNDLKAEKDRADDLERQLDRALR